jgi:hypothetical protein
MHETPDSVGTHSMDIGVRLVCPYCYCWMRAEVNEPQFCDHSRWREAEAENARLQAKLDAVLKECTEVIEAFGDYAVSDSEPMARRILAKLAALDAEGT